MQELNLPCNVTYSPFQNASPGSICVSYDSPTSAHLSPSPPLVPCAVRLPAIPIFDGPDGDLPDISELSLRADDESSDDVHSPLRQSRAGLDYDHEDSLELEDDSRDTSFASNTMDFTDVSSDMSFGPFTPSTSNSRIALRDCGGPSRVRRGLPRGAGLGILGLDFDPSFQSSFADPSPQKSARKQGPDHVIIGEDAYSSGVSYGLNSPTSFGLNEEPYFASGPTLTSIPECDSWNELGDVFRSPACQTEGMDSANTSFSSSGNNDRSNAEEDDASYDLDLSFSFPAHRTSSGSDVGQSTPPRRSRTKSFSSPTISSDLKRASSPGSKPTSSSRGGTLLAQRSPTIFSILSSPEESPFEVPAALPAILGARASASPFSSVGDDEFGELGCVVGQGRHAQHGVASMLPQSPINHPKTSHRRWRM
ncbi:hypothetical protein FA13DRAFT_684760 [Coprinellus micaceus]|uniref:Uncharacterized protein n=1 Tax=Coprinellus micaceus TaxID=71717 RepID=A0A4Y7T4V7_COPMI|nr:hypothetical protein FA13DRAFT_684760 [Coprinellus micaceus]